MTRSTGPLSDRLSRLERTPWRVAAQRVYAATQRGAERIGVHLLRASYDSPIPRLSRLDGEAFSRESPMRGIAWDPDAQMDFVETQLGPYLREFSTAPAAGPDVPPGTFHLDNQTYDRVDAELLYAMLRWSKPRRYVELGSGHSTLVAAEALAANAPDGSPGEIDCFDPYPSAHVLARADLGVRIREVPVQELPEAELSGLAAGDVLFVDTSHTVKLGGDVNRIVLDLLPLLAPGVIVHFHDIFLPRDYSRGHLSDGHYWNEQYLVQAYLAENPRWEVLVGAQAVALRHPARLGALIPSFREGVSPGALWIRRRDG